MKSEVAVLKCTTYEEKKVEMVMRKLLGLIGGLDKVVKKGDRVLIKPNISFPQPPEKGITTHPSVVKSIVKMVIELDGIPVIGDSPVGAAKEGGVQGIWEITGMNSMFKETGCEKISFEKIGFEEISVNKYSGSRRYYISNAVLSSDVVINIPKFKTHSLMTFTGAVKNVFGVVPGRLKGKMHIESPKIFEFADKLVDIYGLVRPQLTIMDGVTGIEGEGPGARGEKRQIDVLMAGFDGIAVDTVSAKIMNLEPQKIPTIKMAAKRKLGTIDLKDISILGEDLENLIMRDFALPVTKVYHDNPELIKKIFRSTKVNLKVDNNLCARCMLCAESCPKGVINDSNLFPVIDNDKCIECFCCLEVCPEGAIQVHKSELLDKVRMIAKRKISV